MNQGSALTKVMLISFSTEAVLSPGFEGGGGLGLLNQLYTGWLLPEVQPPTLLYTIFDRKVTPPLADSAVVKRLVHFYFFSF